MKKARQQGKRLVSLLICFAFLLTYVPVMAAADESGVNGGGSTSVADPKTLSSWEDWFPTDSSRYAGGVFTDKSVYTAGEALSDPYFADIREDLSFGSDNFGNDNFLVALSALGSNSEILGYSYTPTDTVIVLDASTSMGTGNASSSAVDDMVAGANEAIRRLLQLNNYNRVGVVIYNGSAQVLLPLDRYTAGNADGNVLQYTRSNSQNRIGIASGVRDSTGNSVSTTYIAQAQGTYTQGGFYAATQEFLAADPVIEDGKIQGGTHRLPIMVLMSDGQPSYRTRTGQNNTVNKYTTATNQNCDGNGNFQEDDITAFSTMLTAAWSEAEISAHYGTDAYFYTLGYNLDAGHAYAHNVLDPMNTGNSLYQRFKSFADKYLAMEKGETEEFRFSGAQTFSVTRASDPARVTTLDYVDKYWQAANAAMLTAAFDDIVDEIVIQSRYYSTLVSGNEHHQDGFISFTDEIGTHMEVKNIKGIYIGEGKLVSGGMFAEFATTGNVSHEGDAYTEEALDGFEKEILLAITERFEITESEASLLVNVAKDSGFIAYEDRESFSNYIAWYADSDNRYLAPYTGAGQTAPEKTKYIVRSYFYMGNVTQNHVETSMLYALVRVREDLNTGRQIVDIDVPAALLPMVTYTISVDGDVFGEDTVTGMTCLRKKPISLLYEVGLDSDITPYNIVEKMEGQDFRKDEDGNYVFYTNRWRSDVGTAFAIPEAPDPHVFNHGIMNTTVTQFIPSLENERYYYTANTPLLSGDHTVYQGDKPSGSGYYTKHEWVETDNGTAVYRVAYNPVQESVLAEEENLLRADGGDGWFIKKGTPEFYFGEEVHGEQAHAHKADNRTGTLGWSNYPQVVHHESEGHTGYHMLSYLGNNGRVTAAPAQGIRLTKTVAAKADGASHVFTFSVALSSGMLADSYPVRLEKADGQVETFSAAVVSGAVTLTLGDGDTAYLTGLPTGTAYTVTEAYHAHYTPAIENASGVIEARTLTDVTAVNTPKGYGSLLVEKDVTHPFESVSEGLAGKTFTVTVAFEGSAGELAEILAPVGAVTADGGKTYTLTLRDGTDALFTGIPEGVGYTVSETSIPDGFTLVTPEEQRRGTVEKDVAAAVLLVNDYDPDGVSPRITVEGEKFLIGRDWNAAIDRYQVSLHPVAFGGQGTVSQGDPITVDVVKSDSGKDYRIDMSGITYTLPGTYSYLVYERRPDADPVENIAYDHSIGSFSVVVVDEGTGVLQIESVTALQGSATVSGDAEAGWRVEKDFTNTYMAAEIRVPVQKQVTTPAGQPVDGHSGGILLGLFASTEETTPVYSTVTDENGKGEIAWNVLQSDYADTRYFYLREILLPASGTVTGMTYDTSWKYVVSVDWSTGDAPAVRYYRYDAQAEKGIGEELDSLSAQPLTVVNLYEEVRSNPLAFGGKKTLNMGPIREGDRFSFTLYRTDATFALDGATVLQTVTVDGLTSPDGVYGFDGVTFDTAGTKYLVVAEQKGDGQKGIGYDDTLYHITVEVVKEIKDGRSILTATATHIHRVGDADVAADGLDFNNTYTVNDQTSVVIRGSKSLTGRHMVEGEFTFGLFEAGSTTPLYTVTNGADGSFLFPELTYTVTGETAYDRTFTYEIREIQPEDGHFRGVEYDLTVHTVTVTLADNGDGKLKKTVTLDGSTVTDEVTVSFENRYTAAPTQLTLSGIKTLTGKDDGTFTFQLYETDDAFFVPDAATPLKSATAAVTGGTGSYRITLDYGPDQEGLHYYVLTEAVPSDTEGVHYDVTRYHITVNVYDNGNGAMETHVRSILSPYTQATFTVSTLNFLNRYEAAPTEYAIGGTKRYNRTLEAGMFTFVLSNDEGEIARVANEADGSFAFPAQRLETAGDHVFYVTEVNGGDLINGIAYDGAVYTVTVPVVDDGVGNLLVDEDSIVIVKQTGGANTETSQVIFENTYSTVDTEGIRLGGKKTLEGRDLLEKEFEFELYFATETFEKDGFIDSVRNDADGTFTFDAELTFASPGEYRYLIAEKDLGADNVTYDETFYGVIITVADNGQGSLIVERKETYRLNTDGNVQVEDATFVNRYDTPVPPPEDPDIPVTPPEKPDVPKTGHRRSLGVWILLALSGGVLLVTAAMRGRRRLTP